MPHTIPALKIPDTTEQLPKEKAIKQTSEKINNLIPFLSLYFKTHTFFYLHKKYGLIEERIAVIVESITQLLSLTVIDLIIVRRAGR